MQTVHCPASSLTPLFDGLPDLRTGVAPALLDMDSKGRLTIACMKCDARPPETNEL
jgi:hypothetical protein